MPSYKDKMERARRVVPNLRTNLEDDMDEIIARGEELDRKREQAKQAHLSELNQTHDDLDGFEHEIDEFSNSAKRPSNGGDNGEKVVVTAKDVSKTDDILPKIEIAAASPTSSLPSGESEPPVTSASAAAASHQEEAAGDDAPAASFQIPGSM